MSDFPNLKKSAGNETFGPFETYVREKYFLSRSIASSTEQNYAIAAAKMDGYLRAKKIENYESFNVEDTTPDLLSGFVRWYESRVQSRETVRSKRKILIAIVNHALVRQQRVLNSKFVRLPKPQKTLKDTWSDQQVAILVQVAGALPGVLPIGTSRGEYAACLIAVTFETAARRGDLTRITVKDALGDGPFRFIQNKTQHATKFVITPGTQQRIRNMPHVQKGARFVFQPWGGTHLDCLTRLAGNAMRRSGLTSSDGCLKKLRRSSITEAERVTPGTGYVQAGHTTPTVTVSNYIDADTAYADRHRPKVGGIEGGGSWLGKEVVDSPKHESASVIAARATLAVHENEAVDMETMAIAILVSDPSQSKKVIAERLGVSVRSLADGRMPRLAVVWASRSR